MIEKVIISKEFILKLLETIPDPEVPALSIIDLGIVRNVETDASNKLTIAITPTYTGCPAMDVISMNIRMCLLEHGLNNIEIKNILSPAWTTDWMTETGKQKLKDYGIAPPAASDNIKLIQCPQCHSYNIELVSYFGSTACKALYKCEDCLEPFDYFKCH